MVASNPSPHARKSPAHGFQARKKIAFIAPILEYPPKGGPQLSVINAIKVLHKLGDLHIITTVHPDSLNDDAKAFFQQHCHSLMHAPTSRLRLSNAGMNRLIRWLRRLFSSSFARPDAKFIGSYVIEHDISIIWIDRVLEHGFPIFKRLRQAFPDRSIVADTEAVHSRFILRELPYIRNPLKWVFVYCRGQLVKSAEAWMLRQADLVTVVSDEDRDFYQQMASRQLQVSSSDKVKLFSNVVDTQLYNAIATQRTKQHGPPCFVLLGSFGRPNSPMDMAADWLVQKIMPLVWQKHPEARLYIVGKNSDVTQAHLASEQVKVEGSVDSVLPYLGKATGCLVPLSYESGTRFKILEAGAAAVACISTTLGAEGLAVKDRQTILIADEASDFASALIELIERPGFAKQLGQALQKLVSEKYSLDRQTTDGNEILTFLDVERRRVSGV